MNFLKIILFTGLLAAAALWGQDVPLYGMFETQLAYTAPSNPFDVALTAEFTNGSTRITVNGFYAGNNTYKIRFMPEILGAWSYTTSSAVSALNNRTGGFNAVPSTAKGMIRVDKTNAQTSHHFVHANGDRFFYQGNTAKCIFGTPATHASVGGYRNFVDYCAEHHFNHIICYLYAPTIQTSSSAAEGMANWPGSAPSPYAWNNGGKTDYWLCPWASSRDATRIAQYDNTTHSATSTSDIDFSRFYTPYWDKVDEVVSYMKSKNIVANIFFQPDDSYHPSTGTNEDRYYKYGVDRLAAHWNVSFNLGLEYLEYRSTAWASAMGPKVKAWDPYDHILTVHDHLTFHHKNEAWADYIVYQATPGTAGNSTYSSDYAANKPMSNDECGYEPAKATTNALIDIIWQMIMRNCYNSYGNRQQMGMNFAALTATDGAADAHKWMAEFLSESKWYEMGKGTGTALVHPSNTEAILYKSLSVPAGLPAGLPIEFMDVRTGVRAAGGTTPGISKPGNIGTEYAVHIGTAAPVVDTFPPAVSSVRASSQTSVVVTFSEQVEASSAGAAANYSIDNGAAVSAATLEGDLRSVTLTTSALDTGVTYTLTVNNVKDRADPANTIASNSQATFAYTESVNIGNLWMSNGKAYEWGVLDNGELIYIDRTTTFSNLPAQYIGYQYLKTANDDKTATANPFLSFNVDGNTEILIAYDDRLSLPAWAAGFTDTGDDIIIGTSPHSVYRKAVGAGTVTLGANNGVSASSMYVVMIPGSVEPLPGPTGCDYGNSVDVAGGTQKVVTIVADQLTYFAVTAYNGDGESDYSAEASIESATDQVLVSWDPVPGALGYRVYWGLIPCGTTVSAKGPALVSARGALENRPNPFNPSTIIRYRVSKRAGRPDVRPVSLAIYTPAGQKVATLVRENKGPGDYSVAWHGTNDAGRAAPAGVYLLRLWEGGRQFTKKIMLLK